MSRQHHYLKCETKEFQAVERGDMTFNIRLNDRNFKKNDIVYLQETVDGRKTGRELPPVEIRFVLVGGKWGLAPDYCVFNW